MSRESVESKSSQAMATDLDFDFDQWVALAVADMEAFEAKRQAMIEAIIVSSPTYLQPRLRGLQFRIDMERRRSKTPLAACMRISEMMWDMVLGEDGLKASLEALENMLSGQDVPAQKAPQTAAKVLSFEKAALH